MSSCASIASAAPDEQKMSQMQQGMIARMSAFDDQIKALGTENKKVVIMQIGEQGNGVARRACPPGQIAS